MICLTKRVKENVIKQAQILSSSIRNLLSLLRERREHGDPAVAQLVCRTKEQTIREVSWARKKNHKFIKPVTMFLQLKSKRERKGQIQSCIPVKLHIPSSMKTERPYLDNFLLKKKQTKLSLYASRLFSQVKALDSQSRGPVIKTTGWLQGRLSLLSFRGR